MALPWWVLHGSSLGLAAAAATAVALISLERYVSRSLWRKRVEQARVRLGARTTYDAWCDGAEVVLRGRLEATEPIVTADGDELAVETVAVTEAPLDDRPIRPSSLRGSAATELGVADGEARAAIDPEVVVLIGSQVRLTGKRAYKGRYEVVRSLRAGDEVLAAGVLREERAHAYRGSTRQWRLTASATSTFVVLAFVDQPEFRVSIRELAFRRVVPALALAALALFALGAAAQKSENHALASLSPFHRPRALLRLELTAATADRELAGKPRVDRLAELNRRLGDCAGEAKVYEDHAQYRREAERRAECGHDRGVVATAWALSGDLGRASDLVGTETPTGGFWIWLHGVEGRWDRAAAATNGVVRVGWSRREVECLGDALRAKAGDSSALARLERESSEVCSLLHADLLTGTERLRRLAALSSGKDKLRHIRVAAMLRFDAGGALEEQWGPIDLPKVGLDSPAALLRGRLHERAHAIEQALLDRLTAIGSPSDRERGLRCNLAGQAAAFELAMGETSLAGRWADLAESDCAALLAAGHPVVDDDVERAETRLLWRLRTQALRMLVALRVGDLRRARELFAPWSGGAERQLDEAGLTAEQLRSLRKRLAAEVEPVHRQMSSLLDLVEHGRLETPEGLGLEWELADYHQADGWWALSQRDAAGFMRWQRTTPELECVNPPLILGFRATRLDAARVSEWLEYGDCKRADGVGTYGAREAAWIATLAEHHGAPELAAKHRELARRIRKGVLQRPFAVPYALY